MKKNKRKKKAVCSTCHVKFSLDDEGGTEGCFGMIPVAFCPTCLSSCFDMVEQWKKYS